MSTDDLRPRRLAVLEQHFQSEIDHEDLLPMAGGEGVGAEAMR